MRRSQDSPRRWFSALVAILAIAALAPSLAQAQAPAPAGAPPSPVIAAAGDIACAPSNPRYNDGIGTQDSCRQHDTASLLDQGSYSAVLPLGDLINGEDDTLAGFRAAYEPTWGRYRAISRPAIGNHEYEDAGATGYWDYWNGVGVTDGPAGVRARGWYAWDLGSWRLIALNSNCDIVACSWSSRQNRWLRAELHRNTNRCTLAYFHHPRFSSGHFESPGRTRSFWRALYRGGADVVLNGHDHLYERFAPQRPSGRIDRRRGVTQFTVGTGGFFLFGIDALAPNSSFLSNGEFGILAMSLGDGGFGWQFLTMPSNLPIDEGIGKCRNRIDLPR
jgi:acid phosphatase type 7